jgi:hypothetical protein
MRSVKNINQKPAKVIKRMRKKFDKNNPRRMQFNEKNDPK